MGIRVSAAFPVTQDLVALVATLDSPECPGIQDLPESLVTQGSVVYRVTVGSLAFQGTAALQVFLDIADSQASPGTLDLPGYPVFQEHRDSVARPRFTPLQQVSPSHRLRSLT